MIEAAAFDKNELLIDRLKICVFVDLPGRPAQNE